MKKLILLYLFFLFAAGFSAQQMTNNTQQATEKNRLTYQVVAGDTVYLAFIREVHVFPPLKFTNRRQEQFYWRTVRDVKKTLPYAKLVSRELHAVNAHLSTIPDDRERRRFLREYEKQVLREYEPELKKFTINQGRLLLKLIDRECNSTSYDLLRAYRGNVTAIFWQGIARIFGSNLKSEYDAAGNDKIVERVILLVESGQL